MSRPGAPRRSPRVERALLGAVALTLALVTALAPTGPSAKAAPARAEKAPAADPPPIPH